MDALSSSYEDELNCENSNEQEEDDGAIYANGESGSLVNPFWSIRDPMFNPIELGCCVLSH
ncbi:hypothetical protein F442_15210 [Phytophthora nicotianae P10297]|uniref:Uncharacterized protein n=2 Tax=Phytophthora nicotianae TaxID=4792 RepID=W2R2V5_PHYN3|nr:hypothetical protein PPTG_04460 [Phytophthora nicotianae INRA-310]ETN19044.1 hypothetical protein PPTG_04460 [Phytophthora nicotianae INRA-310]ETP36933.1 hypothetical protein F442_15210 [Phytophthora nicotianae P10297]